MLRRPKSIAIVALCTLAIVACGTGEQPTPTSTPTPTLTPTPSEPLTSACYATEAYANELIVAIIGQDEVPNAFDAINTGGCEFNAPVSQIAITLEGEAGTQTATVILPVPMTEISLPLRADIAVPLLDEELRPGRYQRTVTARTDDGRTTVIEAFEPVILVADDDSVQTHLLRAESRWERSGVQDYTYTIEWRCECAFGFGGPVTVRVEHGAVVGEDREGFSTIERLFELLHSAIDQPADIITATFDDSLGYPTDARIDYILATIDDELEFHILSFSRL